MSRNAPPKAGTGPQWEGQAGSGLPKASCLKSLRSRQGLATLLRPVSKARRTAAEKQSINKAPEEWKMQGGGGFPSTPTTILSRGICRKIKYPHEMSGQGRLSSPFSLR